MACKKVLEKAGGNMTDAIKLLRENGVAVAKKKAARIAAEGVIGSYVHTTGKIGVILEVNCETDFAAATPVFKDFSKDMAMHIASIKPVYVSAKEVPAEVIEKEREIYAAQAETENIPEKAKESYINGKAKKFFSEKCLLEQKYYRDPNLTVADALNSCISKIGENIVIKRFSRFEVGE